MKMYDAEHEPAGSSHTVSKPDKIYAPDATFTETGRRISAQLSNKSIAVYLRHADNFGFVLSLPPQISRVKYFQSTKYIPPFEFLQ